MDTTTATVPSRCDHRDARFPSLGCARSLGHDGAHWVTSNAAAARTDLVRIGFFAAEAPASPFVQRARAGLLPGKALA